MENRIGVPTRLGKSSADFAMVDDITRENSANIWYCRNCKNVANWTTATSSSRENILNLARNVKWSNINAFNTEKYFTAGDVKYYFW